MHGPHSSYLCVVAAPLPVKGVEIIGDTRCDDVCCDKRRIVCAVRYPGFTYKAEILPAT